MSAPSSYERRWLILALIATAQLMIVLDLTIVNIALPSAQRDLGFSNDERQWIITSYALAFGSLLLLGGKLGDLFGQRVGVHRRPVRLRSRLRGGRRPRHGPRPAPQPGRPPRCTPTPPASRSFARGRDGNAAASGPGCPCRNHTAPHPPTGRAPPRDGLARGFAGPGRSATRPAGQPRWSCTADASGPSWDPGGPPGRRSCASPAPASSSLSTVCVSARRTSLGGAPTHTPGSSTDTNRPLGNCFQARMRCG